MRLFKKLLSFALAILLLSALPLSSALAEGGAISLSEAESFRGEEVLLTVYVDANPGLMYLSLTPVYDAQILELLSVEPANVDWYVGTSSAIWDADEDSAFTGAVLTLHFRVKEDAPLGSTPVSVEAEAYNYAEEAVPFSVSAGGVTVALPENAGIITVSDGQAAPGETLDLSVSVDTNPGLMYLRLRPVYDGELLELLSMEATAEGWYIGAKAAVWDDTQNSDFTGPVLTLHFRVKDEAPLGQTVVRLQVEAANYNEEEIPFDVRGGQVRIGDAVETVTVSFDAAGGSVSPSSVEVNAGEAVGELPVPTRSGKWVFLGWYAAPAATAFDAGQGTQISAETVFEDDATVYAHWRLPGDVDGDGKVNTADVTLLSKYLKARGHGVTIVPGSGNVDGSADGKVSITDVALLAKYVKARGQGVVIH